MLSFSDDELNTLSLMAGALPPASRDGFLRLVADKLSEHPAGERGPGLLHRLTREAQGHILKGGPIAVGVGGKYGRPKPSYVREDRR